MLARLGLSELLGQAEHKVDRDEHGALIDELGIVVDLLLKGLEQDQDDDPDQVEEQRQDDLQDWPLVEGKNDHCLHQ